MTLVELKNYIDNNLLPSDFMIFNKFYSKKIRAQKNELYQLKNIGVTKKAVFTSEC